MRTIAPAALLPLVLVLAACSPPPFNLSISESATTAKKLTYLGRVGPIDPQTSNQGSEDMMFLPENDGAGGITLQAGFVYTPDPLFGQQVAFIAFDGSQYTRYGASLFVGGPSPDQYPNALVRSVKSLNNMIVFQFDDGTPTNNNYGIATGIQSPPSFSVSSYPPLHGFVETLPFSPTLKEVIGLSIYPDPSATFDRTYWLFREQVVTTNYLEAEFNISQNPIMAPGTALRGTVAYDVSPFAATAANRVLYYFDPNPVPQRSYVSVWDSPLAPGVWSTWVWTDNIPTYAQLTSITNRIDALLTSGEMFSTEGNVGRVFDPTSPTGTLEAQFSLGAIRFIGETYIGGTPTMLFSQALWFNRQVSFNIYSIPTAQLKTLAQ